MMVEIDRWMEEFLQKLRDIFANRIEFVGLQGSYARQEATDSSDIDVVVILDELNTEDLIAYKTMLDTLSNRDLICGFLSGKKELLHWEPSDLFQFYFDTKPIWGTLDALRPLLDRDAVARAVKLGVCNLYHACVHNMLHENRGDFVKDLYKSAVFTIQAIHYQKTGEYVRSHKELLGVVGGKEREIVRISLELKSGGHVDFAAMSEMLFIWAKERLAA